MRLAWVAVLGLLAGCAADASPGPPRWVDRSLLLRPTFRQCVRVGDRLEIGLVGSAVDPAGSATEFLIGIEMTEDAADGQRRIFGGFMRIVAPTGTTGVLHPLDGGLEFTRAAGTDDGFVRVTYFKNVAFETLPPPPYAFQGETEVEIHGDRCTGVVHAERVISGVEQDIVEYPFEAILDD